MQHPLLRPPVNFTYVEFSGGSHCKEEMVMVEARHYPALGVQTSGHNDVDDGPDDGPWGMAIAFWACYLACIGCFGGFMAWKFWPQIKALFY